MIVFVFGKTRRILFKFEKNIEYTKSFELPYQKVLRKMKFRAKMNVAYVRTFHNVLSTMAKLSKSCALKLDQDHMYFIINESGVSGFSAWCQMECQNFFEEHVLEGVTEDAPSIYLELQPGQMAQSLALLKTAKGNFF